MTFSSLDRPKINGVLLDRDVGLLVIIFDRFTKGESHGIVQAVL